MIDRRPRVDVDALLRRLDLFALVETYGVQLKGGAIERAGLCPFHSERSPSFTVNVAKGFYHCFGCGAHGDAISFVQRIAGCDFVEACRRLGSGDLPDAVYQPAPRVDAEPQWRPVMPVPAEAPPLLSAGGRVTFWNAKRKRWWRDDPVRADAYRDGEGRLLGYVLRIEFEGKDGTQQKVTPQVTWCNGDGDPRWVAAPFPRPRPLFGLDALSAKPDALVLVVEGEKCRAVGDQTLSEFAVISWAGGGKGFKHTDWSPLRGRRVILWPDADVQGWRTMVGYVRHDGVAVDGIAQLLTRVALPASLALVDPAGAPKGWDIADAVADGMTPRAVAAFIDETLTAVEVELDPLKVSA